MAGQRYCKDCEGGGVVPTASGMTDEPCLCTYPGSILIAKMEKMIGYVPVGTKDLLSILAHPDVIGLTRAFLDSQEE